MRKHFRIFISSTFEELKDERLEIINHISSKGDIPIGMEFFHPDYRPPQALIEEKIQNSDAVVLCIAANSGSPCDFEEDKTFVQKEIDWALEYNKPIYAFAPESRYEGSQGLLEYYQSNVNGLIRKYSKSSDLPQKFKNHYADIIDSLKDFKGVGLVEAVEFERFESLKNINSDALSAKIVCDALENLVKPKKLISRMTEHSDLRSYAGYTLWRALGKTIFSNRENLNVYYDGGASVANANLELIDFLRRYRIISNNTGERVSISSYTNSPLTQLIGFFFCVRIGK